MPKQPSFSNQDSFDKAFIKVLNELQQLGFVKNVAQLEEFLGFPKRNLYLVLYGHRSVAKLRRHKLLQFFTDNYNVNPKIFINNAAPIFVGEPPTHKDQPEAYFKKSTDRPITMGDVTELKRLRKEMADSVATIKELRKDVKHWQGIAQKCMESLGTNAGSIPKTGHKTGQKRGA